MVDADARSAYLEIQRPAAMKSSPSHSARTAGSLRCLDGRAGRRTRTRQERWWGVEVLDEDNEWADFMVRHATRKDAREYALNVAKDLPELRLRLVVVVERRVTVEKLRASL